MFSFLVRPTEMIVDCIVDSSATVQRNVTPSTINTIFECFIPSSMMSGGDSMMKIFNSFNHPSSILSTDDEYNQQHFLLDTRSTVFLLFIFCCSYGVTLFTFYMVEKIKRLVQSQNQESDEKSLSATKDIDLQIQTQLRNDKMDFISRVGYDVYGYKYTPGGFIDHWRSNEFPTLIPPISIDHTNNIDQTTNCIHGTNHNSNKDSNDNYDTTIEREVYVDYAGAALPTHSQMMEILQRTSQCHTLGNPHSIGPAAARTKAYIEQVTQRIMNHFQAHSGMFYGHKSTQNSYGNNTTTTTPTSHRVDDHPGYELIFTSGTTDAIRIVAERFPWGSRHNTTEGGSLSSSSLFVYAQNSHTSVIGIREVALRRNSSTGIVCQPVDELFETISHSLNCQDLEEKFRKLSIKMLNEPPSDSSAVITNTQNGTKRCPNCIKHLLVAPMECNFSGDRSNIKSAFHKLYDIDSFTKENQMELCRDCQQKDHHQSWYTMLDIAKAASTGPVNLYELNPDFAVVSFYKMFGEPTGLGCLFVKRTAIDVLFPNNFTHKNIETSTSHRNIVRQYVGGGSVNIIVPGTDYTVSRSEPTPLVSLQIGTPHFRGIVALLAGFNELDRVGGMEKIRLHTQCLKQEFVRRLKKLKHGNGRHAIVFYGNSSTEIIDISGKMIQYSGPIITFNVLRADGSYVGYNEVSKLAALYHPPIQLRTGCFCNPGACQIALVLSDNDLIRNYEESGHVCGDPIDMINNHPTGAVRISFGKDSTWEDMNAVVIFLQQMFVSYNMTSTDRILDHARHSPIKVVITELYIFPIKSCAAQRVNDWPMDPSSGRLRFDREFALVDASGAAMRLQMYPAMAQLRPIIDLKAFNMTIHAPDPSFSPLILDLDDEPCHAYDRKRSTVKVCGNSCGGVLWGDHIVSQWFSRYLGVRCWLARHTGKLGGLYEYPKSATTVLPDSYSSLSFANEQPLLLISEHAVKMLNNAMRQSRSSKHPVPNDSVCSRQFRPNIVVRFSGDYVDDDQEQRHVEDSWSQISISDDHQKKNMTLDVVGPCARCAMVDIDPMNGHRVGTLRALATYRRSGNAQITFGIFVRASPNAKSSFRMRNISDWLHIREGNILLCD